MSDIAEIPAGHIGVVGTIAQLHAAESVLGALESTSWLALLPGVAADAAGQILCLFYRDAARVQSRTLPGGAAVLAPGTRVSVRRDAFGRWAVDALDPAGVVLVITADGSAVVRAAYGTSGTCGTAARTASGAGLSAREMARGACALN